MLVLPLLLLSLTFILGLIIGSFLNVVIMRSEAGMPLTGRSHCDSCGKTLTWRELVPLLSFAYQKGRCLHCGTVLSVQYPLVEFGTGMVFAAIAGQAFYDAFIRGDAALLLATCIFLMAAAAMIVIIVADFNYHIIPNGAALFLFVLGIAATLVRNGIVCVPGNARFLTVTYRCCDSSAAVAIPALCHPIWSGVLWDIAASAGAILFFFALWYFSKGAAMGFGDVKLIGATSLLLGFPLSVVACVFAFWLGGLAGIAMLIARTRGLKSQIAFGPFIIAGTVLAFLFGNSFLVHSGFAYIL